MTTSAKDRFEHLDGRRSGVLQRARDAAALTIPSLMPPEGATEDTQLAQPYQSLGARGVNNLASKLLLALLPPNTSFFRLHINDAIMDALGNRKTETEAGLRKLENRGIQRIERSALRTVLHSSIKHLIVVGNGAIHMPTKGQPRMFRLNQYVVLRDSAGAVVEAVIKESVASVTLSQEVREACGVTADPANPDDADVDVFTHIKLDDGGTHYDWHQEIEGVRVPKSDGRSPKSESPYIFLRWTAAENENYGRGLIEEYMGDLRSLEGISKALTGFAAIAAKILFMLKPNATTDIKELRDAETGDIVTGSREDIDVLQLEKYGDFQVSKEFLDELTLRLSHAFLLTSGTVRNAERVTAEEIRAMAQELEDVLGGVYTVLSRELQLPIVYRLIAQMKAENEFPKLPRLPGQKESVFPVIVTGFDALGRGHELNKLRAYFADVLATNPDAVMEFSPKRVAQRFATGHNVDVEDLLKTPEEKQQEAQQAQAAQLMDKAAGPVAGAMAKNAAE